MMYPLPLPPNRYAICCVCGMVFTTSERQCCLTLLHQHVLALRSTRGQRSPWKSILNWYDKTTVSGGERMVVRSDSLTLLPLRTDGRYTGVYVNCDHPCLCFRSGFRGRACCQAGERTSTACDNTLAFGAS